MTEVETPPPVPRNPPRRGWRVLRWSRRTLLVVVAVTAALLVSLVTIDLGPYLKTRAEQIASEYLERPMHIGRLSAALRPGRFVVEDVVIEGLTPDAVPFLKADRIFVSVPWWTLFRRELILEVEMDDWALTIESFPGNRNNVPRLKPGPSSGPQRFATSVRYVWARGGRFRLMDHAQPWEIILEETTINFTRARNLDKYVATVGFRGGVTHILQYEPMRLDSMSAQLRFDADGIINVRGLELVADGTRTRVQGNIHANSWPEQELDFQTNFEVPRMKEIFFFGQNFTASGRGVFTGKFIKYQNGDYDVSGSFATPRLNVSGLDFPGLTGRAVWLPRRLEVVGAKSGFYGGDIQLSYALDTQGGARGTVADLSLTYKQVDLAAFGQAMEWEGFEFDSYADGWQTMTWPSGRFADMRGDGEIRPQPVDGRALAPATLPEVAVYAPKEDPFIKERPLGPAPVGGRVTYSLTPDSIVLSDSWLATPETHLSFRGVTGWHDNANFPLRVVSTDWQASDRLLAAVLTTFGSPTGAIEIGGRGVFDGTLTRWFSRPLIVGRFEGEGLRAWDVVWGRGHADVSIENSYVTVTGSTFGESPARLVADGKYSLGFPRADGGEEIDARITAEAWPLTDWRHFFELDDWPVEGTMFADVRIYGRYRGPEGFGVLRVEPGTAWEETFESFTSRLSFEAEGMRVEGAELTKSTGFVRGAAYIGWPPTPGGWGAYSFTFDGERIPVESLVSFTVPDADLTGVLNFTMRGSGSTETPRYEWDGRVADLFWADEGIGQATARLIIQEDVVTIERLDVASDRLSVSGSGQVAMNDAYDAEVSLRFNETSVDPYLRFVAPQLSPYTQAVVSGSTRIRGQLADLSRLGVDLTIDRADLRLFDYTLSNPVRGETRVPLRMSFAEDVLTICGVAPASESDPCSGSTGAFTLAGEGTSLTLGGRVNRATSTIDLSINGTSNLAILQGVVEDMRSSGDATVAARVSGTFDAPVFAGRATVADGRLRHFSFPHSLDNIHGAVQFDGSGIRVDGLRAHMGTRGRTGGGEIIFGGSIGLDGFEPGSLNLTASGNGLDLRFPEGFRSTVDADVSVTGTTADATVAGRVTVRQARYTRRLQSNAGLLGLASVGGADLALGGVPAVPTELPISFDVDLVGQRLLVIDDSDATIMVSPDLKLTGTLDNPALSGRVDIDRGETEILGNRYTIDGSVEFLNPDRIEPYFVIEARTQIRQPLQEYRLTLTVQGTLDQFTYNLDSDPPLSETDVMSLILGQSPNLQRGELRTLESQEAQNQLMSQFVAQLVASPISTQVGRVVEGTGLVDTFSVTPLLGADATLQQFNPGARVTVGRRISQRVYLTYSRSLDNTRLDHEILLLEYAQNDRMSWVLSRNEDGTFALDFRVRYRF